MFKDFNLRLINNFNKLTEGVDTLYRVAIDKDVLWNIYLDAFPEGTNEIYKERREFDCSCCRHFIKSVGNIVVIKDGAKKSIWDFDSESTKYQPVIDSMREYIDAAYISEVYISKEKTCGTLKNWDPANEVFWDHFFLDLTKFVNTEDKSVGEIVGRINTDRGVFKRSLEEITSESIEIVLELIDQNSLYKGAEWKFALTELLKLQRDYSKSIDKDIFLWDNIVKVPKSITGIKNHSIGTLLSDISEDVEDLDTAVTKYERMVAPENYKRPKATIVTKTMVNEAKKVMTELGYIECIERRHANMSDISVENVLYTNRDTSSKVNDIFDTMLTKIPTSPKKLKHVAEISLEKFIEDVLPKATSLELLLENRLTKNLMSVTTSDNSKSMFKWDNIFGWSYNGNITDSSIAQNVRNAGGKTDGVVRFSIQWNDGNTPDRTDLDAHCIYEKQYTKGRIYYGSKRHGIVYASLDVDIRNPSTNTPAVENIVFEDKAVLPTTMNFFVNCYRENGSKGFKAELVVNGEVFNYEYKQGLHRGQDVGVAIVTYSNGEFKIDHKLPSSESIKEVWGVNTNTFIPVTTVMNSPNYWGGEVGNKHLFFILKDCIRQESFNGFYNEFLDNTLTPNRKFFEILGSQTKVQYSDKQLSGVGFSTTKPDHFYIKVKGSSERILKIKI